MCTDQKLYLWVPYMCYQWFFRWVSPWWQSQGAGLPWARGPRVPGLLPVDESNMLHCWVHRTAGNTSSNRYQWFPMGYLWEYVTEVSRSLCQCRVFLQVRILCQSYHTLELPQIICWLPPMKVGSHLYGVRYRMQTITQNKELCKSLDS